MKFNTLIVLIAAFAIASASNADATPGSNVVSITRRTKKPAYGSYGKSPLSKSKPKPAPKPKPKPKPKPAPKPKAAPKQAQVNSDYQPKNAY